MTTPSGTISAQDVGTEFGVNHPISFSQFYGLGGAPGSGPISLGDMRNRSAYVAPQFEPSPGVYEDDLPQFTASCNKPALWQYTSTGTGVLSSSVPNGSTSDDITLSLAVNAQQGFAQRTVNLTGTSEDVQVVYQVELTAYGEA